MYLKYCLIILFYNKNFAIGYGFFDIVNSFKYLNEELHPEEPFLYSDIGTRWIEQELDHFDPIELRTWKMRYFERLNFWRLNGPIYLFLNGEGPASSTWITTGIMYELAKETNGALFVSEHRYYGESKPFNTTNVKKFKFLTSRQALADNAKLLKSIKLRPIFKNSKVVVVGGSYSGNLAAWMRMFYPELVDAALASSGPVLAKKNFYEYMEKVNDNYGRYGTPNCLKNIKNIFTRYERLMESAEGIKQLKIEENVCKQCDLTVTENQQLFFISMVGEFLYNSQYGNTEVIYNHCQNLDGSRRPRIPHKDSKPNLWLERERCICYDFSIMIEQYYYAVNDWVLAWNYQTCTEFGYFQTLSSESQPFTNNVDLNFYIKICSALFGQDFDEKRVDLGVQKTNKFYGGLTPNVTKVVFTNGDIDPWMSLSVLEDLSNNTPAVVIPLASHCRDLYSNRIGDSIELIKAREHVKCLIKNWIGANTDKCYLFAI